MQIQRTAISDCGRHHRPAHPEVSRAVTLCSESNEYPGWKEKKVDEEEEEAKREEEKQVDEEDDPCPCSTLPLLKQAARSSTSCNAFSSFHTPAAPMATSVAMVRPARARSSTG